MVMGVLGRRLRRMINTSRGQFIALASIVMVGVLIYIAMNTAFSNLSRSQQQFYEENEFADYFFQVIKAPEGAVRQIEALPGVVKASGRIQKDVPVYKEDGGRAIVRLTSYSLPMGGQLNQLHLLSGNLFAAQGNPIQVLVDPQYAAANGAEAGSSMQIVSEGRKVPLTIVGTAISPEFIYPVKDGATIVPDPKEFGILMIPHQQAQQVLNMSGQINQIVVKLLPGTNQEKFSRQAEEILKPYGFLAGYPRKQQLSHAYLQAELDGLKVMSRFMPLIFFLIAASIQYILLSRLIKSQRTQIGIMKAIGYGNRSIMLHYTGYGVAVAIAGTVPGIILGITLASYISDIYAMYFNLPQTIGGVNIQVVLISISLTTAVSTLSALIAARGVTRILPAEAMKASPPRIGGKAYLEKWQWLWQHLNTSWKMSIRAISRNKPRFMVTVLGISCTCMVLILGLFTNDAVDYMMQRHFSGENKYDYYVHFSRPISTGEVLNWKQWTEIQTMEEVLEVPVKISAGKSTIAIEASEDDVLMGLRPGQKLKGIYNPAGAPLSLPEEGILLSERTAKKLGVQVGDLVQAETRLGMGPTHRGSLKVMGINQQLMGSSSYISFQAANRLIGEQRVMTAALLKVDLKGAASLEQRLKQLTVVDTILSREKERQNLLSIMDSMIYFISIMVLFAAIMGLAIMYNASTMNFAERKRELSSLKVLGYSEKEMRSLLSKEIWLQTILGLALGLPAGKLLGNAYMQSVNTDLYSLPAIIYPQTYALTALGVVISVVLGHQLALRRLKNLDMVEAMKERD